MIAHMRNPGGMAGARGVDQTGSHDHREDTEAATLGQGIVGPMLGIASCEARSAHLALIRAAIAADLAGLEVEPTAIETVGEIASELVKIADIYGRARATS